MRVGNYSGRIGRQNNRMVVFFVVVLHYSPMEIVVEGPKVVVDNHIRLQKEGMVVEMGMDVEEIGLRGKEG